MGLEIEHPHLLPENTSPNSNGLGGNGHHVFSSSEHINDIDFELNVGELGVALFTQNERSFFCVAGVHGNDAVAVGLHVLRHREAGATGLSRQAHHGNGATLGECLVDLIVRGIQHVASGLRVDIKRWAQGIGR